jgi:hypothetical protein
MLVCGDGRENTDDHESSIINFGFIGNGAGASRSGGGIFYPDQPGVRIYCGKGPETNEP